MTTTADSLKQSITEFRQSREAPQNMQSLATVSRRKSLFSDILRFDFQGQSAESDLEKTRLLDLERARLSFVFDIINPIFSDHRPTRISEILEKEGVRSSAHHDFAIRRDDGYTGKFVWEALSDFIKHYDPANEQNPSFMRHHALKDSYFSQFYEIFPDNGPSNWNRTSLFTAAEGGNPIVLEKLLKTEEISKINERYKSGHTPFHIAVAKGHLEAVKLLAKTEGLDKETVDLKRNTVVHSAAEYGKCDVLEFLFTDPDFCTIAKKSRKFKWETPFDTACIARQFKAADVFLKFFGPDVIEAVMVNKVAVGLKNNTETLKYLLSTLNGRELACTPNNQQQTAFDLAYEAKNLVAVWLLLDTVGPSVYKDDKQKKAVEEWLETSREYSSYFLFKALQQVGLDWGDRPLSEVDEKGNTLLHQAAMRGDLKMVTYLISKGADIDVMNQDGQIPFDLVSKADVEIAALLESSAKDSSSDVSRASSSISIKKSTTTSSSAASP